MNPNNEPLNPEEALIQRLQNAPQPRLSSRAYERIHDQLMSAVATPAVAPVPRPRMVARPILLFAAASLMIALSVVIIVIIGGRGNLPDEANPPVILVSATPTATSTFTNTPVRTALLPSPTFTDTNTPTATFTFTPSPTPTPTFTPTPVWDLCVPITHPIANRIAREYGVDVVEVITYHCMGYGFGELMRVYDWVYGLGRGGDILALLEQARAGGWDGIIRAVRPVRPVPPAETPDVVPTPNNNQNNNNGRGNGNGNNNNNGNGRDNNNGNNNNNENANNGNNDNANNNNNGNNGQGQGGGRGNNP